MKGKFVQPSKGLKILWTWYSAKFCIYWQLYLLETVILAGIYFIFLKKCPRQYLKGFQYQIWTSVKRSGKCLSSKTNFSTFWKLVALILSQNCVKGLRVTKIVKHINFERVCVKLEARNCFQKQSVTKYLRQTLAFMWKSAL